jgi:pilus assembly protein CpaF
METETIGGIDLKQLVTDARASISDLGNVEGMSVAEAKRRYGDAVAQALRAQDMTAGSDREFNSLVNYCYNRIAPGRLGPLEGLLAAPDVTEVMVNGPDQIFYERHGVISKSERLRFRDDEEVLQAVTSLASRDNKLCDQAHPMCDCVLHRPGESCDQSRVNLVVPPIAVDHPLIDIRKFRKDVSDLDALIGYGTLDEDLRDYLVKLVLARMNILIVGGTGTGKTTLLNAVSKAIPDQERIITIEDTPELVIDKPDLTRLTSRQENAEGRGRVTIRQCVQNALRMRPDRIIVGECRGEETLEMLQAMSTGHDGSLSTVHANGSREAIDRLNVMVHYSGTALTEEIVKEIIASAIDYIVVLERFADGSRHIVDVSEIEGSAGGTVTMAKIWQYVNLGEDSEGRTVGYYSPTGLVPGARAAKKFHDQHIDVDPAMFEPRKREEVE